MLLFKRWKNIGFCKCFKICLITNASSIFCRKGRQSASCAVHTQHKWANLAHFKLSEQIWRNLFCCNPSKEAAAASIEGHSSMCNCSLHSVLGTETLWTQYSQCKHLINLADIKTAPKAKKKNTVIPDHVAHSPKKDSLTLRAKTFFNFLA